jgi:hypothetical protein
VAAHTYVEPLRVEPKAGSVGLKLNSTSVNHVIDSLAALLLAVEVTGKTFNTSIHYSGTGYKFDLSALTFNKIAGPTIKKWTALPDQKAIDITLAGTDLNVSMDASLTALYFIPFDASAVTLKNLSIDFTLVSDA